MEKDFKKLRTKTNILETLPSIITDSDKRYVKQIFPCCGTLLKNNKTVEGNSATYTGWAKTDKKELLRVEAEPRENKDGSLSLALKVVSIPNVTAVELGLLEPEVPDYKSKEVKDFLNQ